MAFRSRAWLFVVNNWRDSDLADIVALAEDSRYLICGFEVGEETGTPHLQCYVYFDDAKTLKRMNCYVSRAHFERATGTPQQNKVYCSKPETKPDPEDIYEEGDLPQQGVANRFLLEQTMDHPYENFHLYNQYRRSYEYLQNQEMRERDDVDRKVYLMAESDIYFIFGAYVQDCNVHDFQAYAREEAVVIPGNTLWAECFVRRWLGGNPLPVVRGYEVIYVNPQAVYLYYRNDKEKRSLRQRYHSLLDNVIDENCVIDQNNVDK